MKFKTRNIIVKCAADLFMPLTAMLGIYVVMHGDSSPGGGFQGGVLVAGALLMLFLGYGTKRMGGRPSIIPRTEAMAEIVYIVVAVVGILAGGNFCLNQIMSHQWELETAQIMNDAVGVNVFTGIGCLLTLMLGLLNRDEEEEGSEQK